MDRSHAVIVYVRPKLKTTYVGARGPLEIMRNIARSRLAQTSIHNKRPMCIVRLKAMK